MRKIALLVACTLLAAVLTACGIIKTQEMDPSQQPHPPNTLVKIQRPDGELVYFSSDDIRALPTTTTRIDEADVSGPSLQAVLKLAGVSGEFKELTLTGSDGSMRLEYQQVNDFTLLVFTNRNTLRLVDSTLIKAEWITDVSLIEVQ